MSFVAPSVLRGFFGGSGKHLIGTRETAEQIVALSGKAAPSVLYLGTATYDIAKSRDAQLSALAQLGCKVQALEVTRAAAGMPEMKAAIAEAEVIVVSGGNTLWAVDRWNSLGLPDLLREAMLRGAVLAGGSAGAICWFDGGHSDSMDPHTYLATPYLFTGESGNEAGERPNWEYIRVPGLGFLPGLICPHHDRVQSNGIARAEDIGKMLMRHPGEQGICIDHFAALVVEGDSYSVFALEGQEGSVMEDGSLSLERGGKPGVWRKSVAPDGGIAHALVPREGRMSDLLRPAAGPIVVDPRLEVGRRENPQPPSVVA